MSKYIGCYGVHFEQTATDNLTEKDRQVLGNAIKVILENPKKKATTVETYKDPVLWRKHVCGETKRLIYTIEEEPTRKVTFIAVLPKNNKTYIGLWRYL